MAGPRRNLGETTFADVAKALRRYQPFVLAVTTLLLVVVFLPGKPGSSSNTAVAGGAATQTGGPVSGSSSAGTSGGAGTASTAGSGAASAAGGTAGSGVGGTGVAGSGTSGAGGSSSTGGGGGFTDVGNGTSTSPSAPTVAQAPTNDPFCNQATGRTLLPSLYAPPCVPEWTPAQGNGGNTYNGVTASTITVAVPIAAQASEVYALAGDTDSQSEIEAGNANYVNLFEHHYQTYGRKVKLVYYNSSYNAGDSLAQQNAECQSDATKVANQIHALVSWPDCGTNAYENTLVNDGVMCFCTVSVAESNYLQWAPYVWGIGEPDETSGYLLRSELICNDVVPFAPKYAGEADLNAPLKPKRVFGLIWAGPSPLDDTSVYQAGAESFKAQLEKCGAYVKDFVSFPIIDPNGPADATNIMAKFKSDGVTTVLPILDPIDPVFLTDAATHQAYFPEWFNVGSAGTDLSHYERLFDQSQWRNSFGIGFAPDQVTANLTDAYHMYAWEYGTTPPDPGTYQDNYPFFIWLFTAIQAAGPDLTPYHAQCGEPPYTSTSKEGARGSSQGVPCVGKTYGGLFGYIGPYNWQQRVTNPLYAFGDHFWAYDFYNLINDATLIWWNSTATGPDTYGAQGTGENEYMFGGKRYLYGQIPTGNQPWFSTSTNPAPFTTAATLPAGDRPPSVPYKCYYLCNSPGY
jgi:hypothetical protein